MSSISNVYSSQVTPKSDIGQLQEQQQQQQQQQQH